MRNTTQQIWIKIILVLISFNSCILNDNNQTKKTVKFVCNEIIIDTTRLYISILFRINVSNFSKKKYYFFSNVSTLNRDSVKSNFYLWDTVRSDKYQLLVAPGPVTMELYPGHHFDLPVSMIHEISYQQLKNMTDQKKALTDHYSFMALANFLKGSKLIFINNKTDFIQHHVNLKYSFKDTINITYKDSTPIYLAVPYISDFINDSLFKQNNSPAFFLN